MHVSLDSFLYGSSNVTNVTKDLVLCCNFHLRFLIPTRIRKKKEVSSMQFSHILRMHDSLIPSTPTISFHSLELVFCFRVQLLFRITG